MADVDVERSDRFEVTLEPDQYGLALRRAFSLIQQAHPIIVAAIEKRSISFVDIECYVAAFRELQVVCGCEHVLASAFLDEAVDAWDDWVDPSQD